MTWQNIRGHDRVVTGQVVVCLIPRKNRQRVAQDHDLHPATRVRVRDLPASGEGWGSRVLLPRAPGQQAEERADDAQPTDRPAHWRRIGTDGGVQTWQSARSEAPKENS